MQRNKNFISETSRCKKAPFVDESMHHFVSISAFAFAPLALTNHRKWNQRNPFFVCSMLLLMSRPVQLKIPIQNISGQYYFKIWWKFYIKQQQEVGHFKSNKQFDSIFLRVYIEIVCIFRQVRHCIGLHNSPLLSL